MLSSSKDASLELGWLRYFDENTRRHYFFNHRTQKSQYEKPPGLVPVVDQDVPLSLVISQYQQYQKAIDKLARATEQQSSYKNKLAHFKREVPLQNELVGQRTQSVEDADAKLKKWQQRYSDAPLYRKPYRAYKCREKKQQLQVDSREQQTQILRLQDLQKQLADTERQLPTIIDNTKRAVEVKEKAVINIREVMRAYGHGCQATFPGMLQSIRKQQAKLKAIQKSIEKIEKEKRNEIININRQKEKEIANLNNLIRGYHEQITFLEAVPRLEQELEQAKKSLKEAEYLIGYWEREVKNKEDKVFSHHDYDGRFIDHPDGYWDREQDTYAAAEVRSARADLAGHQESKRSYESDIFRLENELRSTRAKINTSQSQNLSSSIAHTQANISKAEARAVAVVAGIEQKFCPKIQGLTQKRQTLVNTFPKHLQDLEKCGLAEQLSELWQTEIEGKSLQSAREFNRLCK